MLTTNRRRASLLAFLRRVLAGERRPAPVRTEPPASAAVDLSELARRAADEYMAGVLQEFAAWAARNGTPAA